MSNTSTSPGSRVIGNVVIKWTPSDDTPKLTVEIDSSGNYVDSFSLQPEAPVHKENYIQGNNKMNGSFKAEFDATGKHGKLSAIDLKWDLDGNPGEFSGALGTW